MPAYLHHRCVHCGERIACDDWNESPDSPAHRLCANSQPSRVWEAPLGVWDMQMVWTAMKKGRAPQRKEELVEALRKTISHDRATYDDNEADWYAARRRKSYARKLLAALYAWNNGSRPAGRFRGG